MRFFIKRQYFTALLFACFVIGCSRHAYGEKAILLLYDNANFEASADRAVTQAVNQKSGMSLMSSGMQQTAAQGVEDAYKEAKSQGMSQKFSQALQTAAVESKTESLPWFGADMLKSSDRSVLRRGADLPAGRVRVAVAAG